MKMTMRWYGETDPVSLAKIRQVPGVQGVVSALYDVPIGDVWSLEKIAALQSTIEANGLQLEVIESVPVPEAIKIGLPQRDQLIENYQQSIRNVGKSGIPVICYNFSPLFDWWRTDLAMPLDDGSTTLCYLHSDLPQTDLSVGITGLPGWAVNYSAEEYLQMVEWYRDVDAERLFDNLSYFLKAIIPVAEEAGVFMALHPDDPPWSIFGLPRIVSSAEAIARILAVVDSPHNGLTFCTGSLGTIVASELPELARQFGKRINFVHARNVKVTQPYHFYETAHPSVFGDVDMFAVIKNLVEVGFGGPIRSDHGRLIWNEEGRPGYGLFDRALGEVYLYGLIEAVERFATTIEQ